MGEHGPAGRAGAEADGAPLVSVVIPAYNAAATLPLQLEALSSQVDAPPFEVIIADNRSTDGLRAVVEQYQDGGFDLRMVSAGEHQGSSYARNVGIAAARTDAVMFCDADDVVSRHWVERGWRVLQDHPIWTGAAIGYPEREFAKGLENIRRLMDNDGSEGAGGPRPSNRTFPVLMGGNFGARRRVLLAIGGFDQSFPHAGDDNDLAFRAGRAGYPVAHAGRVRIAYRAWRSPQAQRRAAFRSAVARAQLADRYDVWSESPASEWALESLRCVGAGVKMLTRPSRADWPGLLSRGATAAGATMGAVQFRLLRRRTPPLIGQGLPVGLVGSRPRV